MYLSGMLLFLLVIGCNAVQYISLIHIWKHTVSTNATNVILYILKQVIWGNIWKDAAEKSQTNATNLTMALLQQNI